MMNGVTKANEAEVVPFWDHLKSLMYSTMLPLVFPEHSTVMAANVLNSPVAIKTSITVIRAFVRTREILAEHLEIKQRLENREQRVVRGFQDSEEALQVIRFAIQQLITPPETKPEKSLGFGRDK